MQPIPNGGRRTLHRLVVRARKAEKQLEELQRSVNRNTKAIEKLDARVEKVEVAVIGQWREDGTYSDGLIQIHQRDVKTIAWIGGTLTVIFTGLLLFALENFFSHHLPH